MEEQSYYAVYYPNASSEGSMNCPALSKRKAGISMLEKLISLRVLTILFYLLFFQISMTSYW